MIKVKICGITSLDDALNSIKLGADAIGTIVEVPVETPRKITKKEAGEIHASLPILTPGVAVIIAKSIDEAVAMAQNIRPYALQLHGNEDIEFLKDLKDRIQSKIIKTIHVKDETAIEKAEKYSKYCDAILLDTSTPELGGSGVKHDWSISKKIVEQLKKPVILAGGLNPENVQEAVKEVKPYAVDVSSGVETKAGQKDYDKVRRFIENAKGAS